MLSMQKGYWDEPIAPGNERRKEPTNREPCSIVPAKAVVVLRVKALRHNHLVLKYNGAACLVGDSPNHSKLLGGFRMKYPTLSPI